MYRLWLWYNYKNNFFSTVHWNCCYINIAIIIFFYNIKKIFFVQII